MMTSSLLIEWSFSWTDQLQTVMQTTASGLEVPTRTRGQLYVSLFVVAVLLIAVLVAYRRTRFAGLTKQEQKHKSALLGGLRDQTPESVHIPRTADVEEYRGNLEAAFDRVHERCEGGEADHDPDRVSIREASRSVAVSFRETALESIPTIPTTAWRIGVVGILVGILGAIAVSTETIVQLLGVDADRKPAVDTIIEEAITHSQAVVEQAIIVSSLFPEAGELTGMVFVFAVLLWSALYSQYYVLTVLLLLFAGAIALLDRLVPAEIETDVFEHDGSLVIQSLGALVGVWLAGVFPAGVGALIGEVNLVVVTLNVARGGVIVGALLAMGAVVVVMYVAGQSFIRRVRHASTVDWENGPDSMVATYLMVRYVAVGLAFAAAPLIPLYIGAILFRGTLVEVLTAFSQADITVQLSVLLGICLVVAVIAYAARDSWDDVRAAVGETLSRNAVRLALFKRGLSFAAMLFAFALLWGFTRSLLVAGLGAVLFGALVFGGYTLVDRASYRLSLLGDDDPVQSGVLVQCYALPDANGNRHAVAKVGSDHTVSRQNATEAVSDALTVAEAIRTRHEDVPMTVGRKRGEDLLRLGRVDTDVEKEIRERVRKTLKYRSLNEQEFDVDELEDWLSEYPEDIWWSEFTRYRMLGILRVTGNGTVQLQRDVWSAETNSSTV